jgi:hypothetical protein
MQHKKTLTKAEVLHDLETMLHDVLTASDSTRSFPRVARAQGYIDGFMRGLLDTGFATKEELLEIVARERTRAAGPATREGRARVDDAVEQIVAA